MWWEPRPGYSQCSSSSVTVKNGKQWKCPGLAENFIFKGLTVVETCESWKCLGLDFYHHFISRKKNFIQIQKENFNSTGLKIVKQNYFHTRSYFHEAKFSQNWAFHCFLNKFNKLWCASLIFHDLNFKGDIFSFSQI